MKPMTIQYLAPGDSSSSGSPSTIPSIIPTIIWTRPSSVINLVYNKEKPGLYEYISETKAFYASVQTKFDP